ncbi:MAG: DUF1998 domain-containing protein [Pyrinomonadaceae bacterium]
MNKNTKLSPSAVIFNTFPDAFRNYASSIIRVKSIIHPDGDANNTRIRHVLENIARRMSHEKNRVDSHYMEIQHRAAANKSQSQVEGNSTVLDDIFGDIEIETEIIVDTGEKRAHIQSKNLSFILVDDDSTVRTKVFPRSFHCSNCNHFEYIDPSKPPRNLLCTHCKRENLVQEPIVFMCARCANLREMVPPGESVNNSQNRKARNVKDLLGSAPGCPDCRNGHIHLEKHNNNNIGVWEWKCSNNQCQYQEQVKYSCLECYLPALKDETNPENTVNASMISMNAFPAAAPSALRGLFEVQMFIHNEPLDPSSLQVINHEAAIDWIDYFNLNFGNGSVLETEDLEQIHSACIENVFLLNRVGIVTTVYGYRAGNIASHSVTPTAESDRLARFFKDPEGLSEYVCYGMMNDGSALVIELNKQRIINRLSEITPSLASESYDDVLSAEFQMLQNLPMKNLLETRDNDFILFRSLHALEHAILTSSMQQIGNDVLGSKLFPKEGILLIYEREPIGRGGVVQLVNKGEGLLSMIEAARDQVIGCAQGCIDGCPACIFVRDAHCNYNYNEMERNWLPANSLLSRLGARRILFSDLPL